MTAGMLLIIAGVAATWAVLGIVARRRKRRLAAQQLQAFQTKAASDLGAIEQQPLPPRATGPVRETPDLMGPQPRVPRGTPDGGQFSSRTRPDADVDL